MAEVFRQSALGLMSILVDRDSVELHGKHAVRITGRDRESLLVRWLSEILYLYDGEHFITAEVEIQDIEDTSVRALLGGEHIDTQKHRLRTDVKAVTYHQLAMKEDAGRIVARVFLDI